MVALEETYVELYAAINKRKPEAIKSIRKLEHPLGGL